MAVEPAAQASLDSKQPAPRMWRRLCGRSADFWREFMFWWAEHFPRVVLWTRPFWLWGAWRFAAKFRNDLLTNARRLLGPDAGAIAHERLAKRILHNLYTAVFELADCARLTLTELAQRIDGIEGADRYYTARESGKGAIMATAHIGSFEIGIAAVAEREPRIHVVFQRDAFARFESLRTKLRRALGVIEAPVDDGWSLWARLRDALERDEVVMIQADRVMPGQRGVPVPFFDGHILMPAGPLKLAAATQAPIIPVFSIRTDVGRVRVVVEEAIYVTRGDGPINERHPAALKLAAAIEKHVRAHPDQWLMPYPVWCEDLHGGSGDA